MKTIQSAVITLLVGAMAPCSSVLSQVEQSGWGELRGIRVDGELFTVKSSLGLVAPGWENYAQTAHWRTQAQGYEREEDSIVSRGRISFPGGEPVSFEQRIIDVDDRTARIALEATVEGDMTVERLFFAFRVPHDVFGKGGCLLMGTDAIVNFAEPLAESNRHYRTGSGTGVEFRAGNRRVEITFDSPREVAIEKSPGGNDRDWPSASILLGKGDLTKGQTFGLVCTIRVEGPLDQAPATVTIDASNRGRSFDGVGGNFCWQTQSPTVDFYLDNLRVVWGRVSMPLNDWQPEEDTDPSDRPLEEIPESIRETFRMAGELHRRGIPMMISSWNAPRWALQPRAPDEPRRGSRPLAPEKVEAVTKSIGSYLLYFKNVVGVEPLLFSFNEPNLGINVLQSPEEHRDHIKIMGPHFESLGLKTRLLLGDANEPRAVDYVLPSLEDEEALKYVGAISYHSWNGGTDEQLTGWGEHAKRAGVPLFIGEAGTDPDSHRYRPILNEPWYALDEAVSFLRCITFSQPQSILHWQLTPDYGFVQESDDPENPIRTSQRWWQYKQLSDRTPPGAAILGVACDTSALSVSALGADGRKVSVIHVANPGAERIVNIEGVGTEISTMDVYVTDAGRDMEQMDPVNVSNGGLSFTMPAMSFVSLVRTGNGP